MYSFLLLLLYLIIILFLLIVFSFERHILEYLNILIGEVLNGHIKPRNDLEQRKHIASKNT